MKNINYINIIYNIEKYINENIYYDNIIIFIFYYYPFLI